MCGFEYKLKRELAPSREGGMMTHRGGLESVTPFLDLIVERRVYCFFFFVLFLSGRKSLN